MTVGNHVVTVAPAGGGAAVDISCLVDTVSMHYGRDDTSSQPDPNACTLEMSLDTDTDAYPAALDVAGILTVTTTVAGTTFTRFVGKITDREQTWEDAGEDTPSRQALQVIAAGPLADLGRRVVGDTPWPQQLDGARVSAIMAAAGVTLDPAYSDPGTVQILARDVDSQPALDVAQETAGDASGVVWATRDGQIRYADADHRRNVQPVLEIDSCDILVTPKWTRNTAGLINKVSIGYGVAPDGGDQPRFVDDRPQSQATYGRFEFVTGTQLAASADAAAMGEMLLTRNSTPVWIMDQLPVDLEHLDDARTKVLLGLQMHDLIQLTGLPAADGAPTSAFLWVEGWSESLEFGSHDINLSVSGYCRTVPPPRWNDVPPEMTWDSMGSLTWDGASCFGPNPNRGRWDDVPASLRWNQVDPAITWDAWPH